MENQQTQEVTQQTIPNGLWAEELPQEIDRKSTRLNSSH